MLMLFFFFKQKTAYDMRISDWSSDVCSSDLTISYSKEGEHDVSRSCNRLMSPRHTWPDSLHTFEKGRQNRRLINEERDVREAGSLLKHRLRRISRPVRSFEESCHPVETFSPSLSDT